MKKPSVFSEPSQKSRFWSSRSWKCNNLHLWRAISVNHHVTARITCQEATCLQTVAVPPSLTAHTQKDWRGSADNCRLIYKCRQIVSLMQTFQKQQGHKFIAYGNHFWSCHKLQPLFSIVDCDCVGWVWGTKTTWTGLEKGSVLS